MRKICPRCRGRGYHNLTETWTITKACLGQDSYTYFGPPPMKCWRCEGRGWVEVWAGYARGKGEGR